MGTLLGFAPFLAFFVIERLGSVPVGLAAGAVTSALLLVRDILAPTRRMKVLEIGTFLLFGVLTLLALLPGAAPWSITAVRLRVDAGLLLIVVASLLVRRPFTLQYAREQVPSHIWDRPEFLKANYVITSAWAVAFIIMVTADLALIYLPELPRQVSIVTTIAAIIGAVKFTAWYPRRSESQAVPRVTNHPGSQ